MADTYTRRSDEDIAALKRSWIEDGCWNIEDTEGFEAHRDELRTWREKWLADREADDLRDLEREAAKEGVSVDDMRGIQSAKRQEERAMESAMSYVRHLYIQGGGNLYRDIDADFNSLVDTIAEVAEARVTQTLIRAFAKIGKHDDKT